MDPAPLVNEPSFTTPENPSSPALAVLLSIPMSGGELGLRMGSFSAASGGVEESTVTEHSVGRCVNGGGKKRRFTLNSYDDGSYKFVPTRTPANQHFERPQVPKFRNENGDSRPEGEENHNAVNEKTIPEPPKDYIHVRARRGQATDSHSLAERARREKISERMKILQDLVPGCNKIVGKALVLDEIINYIQSLQHQVEFLSMKLEAVCSRFPSRDLASRMLDGNGMG